ncbi:hypothetical protein BH11GEM1_BH11GEM1_34890 [soil metagenome]
MGSGVRRPARAMDVRRSPVHRARVQCRRLREGQHEPETASGGEDPVQQAMVHRYYKLCSVRQVSIMLRVIELTAARSGFGIGTRHVPRFFQTSDRSRAVRGLLLSASWTFGKPEKDKDTIDLSGDNTE